MGIHHSVYYYHKNNKTNRYKENNKELDKKILEIYTESKRRYGSPKIQKVLASKGTKTSQKRVARRMRKLGIRSIVVKKYNYVRNKRVDDTNKPNLLEQDFKATKPKEKWVGDITYIYTKDNNINQKWKNLNIIKQKTIQFIFDKGDVMTQQIAEYIERDRKTAQRILKKLENEGLIEWVGTSNKDPKKYIELNKVSQ